MFGQDDEDDEVEERDPSGRFARYTTKVGKGRFKCVFKGFDEKQGIDIAWSKVLQAWLPLATTLCTTLLVPIAVLWTVSLDCGASRGHSTARVCLFSRLTQPPQQRRDSLLNLFPDIVMQEHHNLDESQMEAIAAEMEIGLQQEHASIIRCFRCWLDQRAHCINLITEFFTSGQLARLPPASQAPGAEGRQKVGAPGEAPPRSRSQRCWLQLLESALQLTGTLTGHL